MLAEFQSSRVGKSAALSQRTDTKSALIVVFPAGQASGLSHQGLSTPKPDGKRFVHYSYTLCRLRPTLKRRAYGTKPGKPGSQGTSVPFVG
jgi:hypothetical protein